MSQHAGLSPERWAAFSLDQQVLMIANEMNRAAKLMAPADRERLRSAYERILQLADLTVQVAGRAALRRELLRWRDLVAGLYVAAAPDPTSHATAHSAGGGSPRGEAAPFRGVEVDEIHGAAVAQAAHAAAGELALTGGDRDPRRSPHARHHRDVVVPVTRFLEPADVEVLDEAREADGFLH